MKPIGAGWVPSGRIMFTTPVVILGLLVRISHHVLGGDLETAP